MSQIRQWLTDGETIVLEHDEDVLHSAGGELIFTWLRSTNNLRLEDPETFSMKFLAISNFLALRPKNHRLSLPYSPDSDYASSLGLPPKSFLGFRVVGQRVASSTYRERSGAIVIPYWSLIVLFSFPFLAYCYRIRRTHSQVCICKDCGYDLRATPDRCPECGKTTKNPIPTEQTPI
jgi:hypothetical protein